MNVISPMSDLTKVPTATLQAKSINLRPMASDPDSKINAKEARAEAFYTKEEEPWKKGTVHFSEGGVDKTRAMTKDEYLDHIRTMSVLDIEIQQCQFAKFRDNVVSLRPDLAGLNISYTLDEEGQIKILDPGKVFNSEQLEWLTDSANKIKDFKQTVQSHARKMMELVDHDTETFGNRYVLNLSNFANTIDYGLIISIKDQHEMNNAWITQILEKGEHREERMIDIRA